MASSVRAFFYGSGDNVFFFFFLSLVSGNTFIQLVEQSGKFSSDLEEVRIGDH